MWTAVDYDAKKWEKFDAATSKYDAFFRFSPPADIRDTFQKQFAGKKDLPIISSPLLVPGFYLGTSPDLSPGSSLREWLEKSKTPFYIMTNYASGAYTDKTGPATYAALTGPLAGQFLGYVHGEAFGTGGVGHADVVKGNTRREHVDAFGKLMVKQQADAWSKIYKTKVDEQHWQKGIACLSVDSIALAHLYHETGAKVVGYELDATNVHMPMRIAFERGAARQYGGAWINYASGNFGDACNYFTQNPVVPRGAELVPQQVRGDRRRERRLVPQDVLPQLPRRGVRDLLGAGTRQPVDDPRSGQTPGAVVAVRPRDGRLPRVRGAPA